MLAVPCLVLGDGQRTPGKSLRLLVRIDWFCTCACMFSMSFSALLSTIGCSFGVLVSSYMHVVRVRTMALSFH